MKTDKQYAEDCMSLSEMCNALGITRRAVQGYEAHGLLQATGKTSMGHLFYNKEAQQKVQEIHRFQTYGFQVKEIRPLFTMPKEELCKLLEEKHAFLCKKNHQTSQIILQLQDEIQNLKK